MTTENSKSGRHVEPAVTLAELADGDYVDMEEAAGILGLTSAELRRLRSEQINGGRVVKRGDYVANVPVSARAALIPEPRGELRRTIVWDRAALLAVAEEIKAARPRRKNSK